MNLSPIKSPLRLAGVGLLLGIFADLLVYDSPSGISFPIVMAACIVALVTLGQMEGKPVTWVNAVLGVPLVYLAIMSAVRSQPFLRFLNIAGALLLLTLLTNRFLVAPFTTLNIGGYARAIGETWLMSGGVAPPAVLGRSAAEWQSGDVSRVPVRRVLVGALLAAPFLLIFTILLASADQLFEAYARDIFGDITLADIVGHSLLTGVLTWVAMGGLAYALSRVVEPATKPAANKGGILAVRKLGNIEASVALYSIDALFAAFVAVQFAALFGGEAFLESKGLTYAEYARRGFFELLAVALITLGFILLLDFVTRRETSRQRASFVAGTGLMIGLTIVMLVSAYQRLRLYELAFGFTRLRLNTHVFMVWLAGLLALVFILLLVKRTRLFASGALVALIGFTVTLNVVNPDVFITRHNLLRYEQGRELDVSYVGNLSADAVPYILPLLDDYGPEIREEIGPWLRLHLLRLDARHNRADWRASHTSINRAYLLLDGRRFTIEQYDPASSFMFAD